LPYARSEQPSYDHLGLDVPSEAEVDRMAQMAQEDGTLVFGPENMGPVAGYLCLIEDPDGNRIEFSNNQPIDGALNGK
jgi:catechol 2,3-dioxygenase-like lactoylglutathione lyase family enzyme